MTKTKERVLNDQEIDERIVNEGELMNESSTNGELEKDELTYFRWCAGAGIR